MYRLNCSSAMALVADSMHIFNFAAAVLYFARIFTKLEVYPTFDNHVNG